MCVTRVLYLTLLTEMLDYPSKASVARKQMRLRRSIYHSDDASDLDLRKRESRKRSRDPRTRSTDSRKISRGARRRSRAPQRSRDPHSTDEEILIEEPGRRQEPGEIVETRRKARQSNEEYGLKSVLLTPVTDLSLEDLRLELTSRSLEKEAQEESDKKRYMRRRKIHDECAWIYEEIVRKTAQMDAHKKIEEERERLRDEIRAEFEETRRKEVEDAHHKSLQEAEEREKPNRGVREGLREESRAQFGEKDGGKSKGEYGTSTYSEEGLHARQLHYASHPTYSPIARIKALANNFYNTWFSRPPEYGKTRIAWQCPCGQRIHDDYVELERGALKSLQRELNGFSRKLSSPGFRSHSNGRHEANVSTYRGSDGTPQQEEPKHTSSPKDAGDTSDMDLESGPAGNVAEASKKDMSRAQPMHLVLGHPNLYLATRLRQPDTSDYSSDLEFFQSLRDHYYAFRGIAFRRVFSLRSLAQVRFVRFEMFKGGIAEIRKLDDIPPDELCQRENKSQHGDAYTYQPRPAPTIPPLGSATIQHLMQHFDTVDKAETNIFERFPRKLFDELKVSIRPTLLPQPSTVCCCCEEKPTNTHARTT